MITWHVNWTTDGSQNSNLSRMVKGSVSALGSFTMTVSMTATTSLTIDAKRVVWQQKFVITVATMTSQLNRFCAHSLCRPLRQPLRSKCSLCCSVSWLGVGGTPSSLGQGVPQVPPTWTWDGVPPHQLDGYPHLELGWSTPQLAGWVPPTWTWDGVPSLPGPGMGYPPPGPEMGYPPPPLAGWGTPLPKCGQTDTCEKSERILLGYSGVQAIIICLSS